MATAIAHPNIALIKYWGKRDVELNLPSTGSLSVTLGQFQTRTTVRWDVPRDVAWLDGQPASPADARKVFKHLDLITPGRPPARVISHSNFPAAAGLASSSSAFAALTLAAAKEANEDLPPEELSILARQGSGSACRSLWGGWVEWRRGVLPDGFDSHGQHLAPEDHWDLRVVVAIVDGGRKKVGSTKGMLHTMETSPMYPAWVFSAERDLDQARHAVLERDLESLGQAMERSTQKMQATMMTADPALRYWRSTSLWAIETVEELRAEGVSAWWTMDAGPNVKVLCEPEHAERVAERLRARVDEVLVLGVGGPPELVEDDPEELSRFGGR